MTNNIEMLQLIAKGLGELKEEVVYGNSQKHTDAIGKLQCSD